MNAYLVLYGAKQTKVYAKTLLEAKEKGVEHYRVPEKKQHLVSAHLVEKDGQAVTQVLA